MTFHEKTGHEASPYENRLDVRVRLMIALTISVVVLVLSHPISLGLLGMVGAFYMGMLRRWRVQLICYGAILALAVLSVLFLYTLQAFMPMMRGTGPTQLIVPFLRMLALLHAVMPLALTICLRDVLSMMKSLRFPRALYLPLAVTIRFVPGLVNDLRQMRDCLRLRGYRGWNLFRPRLWLLPVVFRCLHLTDELAIAAELKSVGYGRPAHPKGKRFWNGRNVMAIVLLVCVVTGTAWLEQIMPTVLPLSHDVPEETGNDSAHVTDPREEGADHAAS
jgi:energy-coupling factor transport system permease protein